MKLSASIFALLAVATFSSVDAAPAVSADPAVQTLTIPLAENPSYQRNATRAVLKARGKYSRFINSPTTFATGTVPMTDYLYDVEYYGTVKVGTPAQSLKLDFDTGSADLWFASTLCTNCGSTQTKFDSTKSSTYVSSTKTWSISYGDGSSASGVVGFDTVNLGGLSITGQGIELAKKEAAAFQSGPIDGLLGLAFDTIITATGVKTPMDNLISQGLITSPVFGVYLGRQTTDGAGEYVFGGYNSNHINGALTTVPVDSSDGFWTITASAGTAGTTSLGSFSGILDTGTSLMLFTNTMAAKVAKAYGATDNYDGTYTIKCDTSSFSPLTFTIAGTKFSIPAADLVYYRGTTCIASFAYANLPFAIFGDAFLKSHYVIYNQAIPNVQIALSK
ncbi:secreted aspartyl protease [Phycomyces blakesleeanus]|uniref:Secreted aspartyl protease n=2 Tax=Phycomyces blakesleeanus TaxID=4837 RepID=A0A167PXW0_PHYB8|nr:secreted aspartyl protease [Phycomyces blakesleeanus NRRL 1555(-)]OAD78739.1 secreted aspartyl protease [Phycomyces blakesleeanus NRRL 1555(-)]|eukprot:XP_018296779.1 secreted aspartyl protease [Phycomyces blakesleeanus NRRL 1555(-)]